MARIEFVGDNAVAIVFGLIGVATSAAAIYYARKMYELEHNGASEDTQRSVRVYWSRERMIHGLYDQYDAVGRGDIIWANTVGLQAYPGELSRKMMDAAARGARFCYLVDQSQPGLREFVEFLSTISSVRIAASADNRVRMQGIRGKEVIIAFPTLLTYTAIRFTDPDFVAIIDSWFGPRWRKAIRDNPIR